MGEKMIIGYLIMAARAAHMNVKQEEKLVESMMKVLKEHLPSDAVEKYMDWFADEVENFM